MQRMLPDKSDSKSAVTILAISGGSSRIDEDEAAQRRFWANKIQRNVFMCWVKGGGGDAISLDDDRNLWIPVQEKFENILLKRVLSLRFALTHFPSQFYLLTNSSSYIRVDRLLRDLSLLPENGLYAGPPGIVPGIPTDSTEGLFYVGGGFILISHDVAQLLSEIDASLYFGSADDVAIGRHLFSCGIIATPLAFSNLSYGEPISDTAYIRVRHIKNPEITRARMSEICALDSNKMRITIPWTLREGFRMWSEVTPHQFGFRKTFFTLISTLRKPHR